MFKLKKIIYRILYPVFLYVIIIACTKNSSGTPPAKNNSFRVLGYLMSADNWNNDLAGIDLSKITDLNLAFFNPDSTGKFTAPPDLQQVVEKAHAQHVRIFFSIGGGDAPPYLSFLMKADQRAAVIAAMVAVANNYQFDGIDVDLEGDFINGNYAAFVSDLSTALKSSRKLMTAALASWNANLIDDATFQKYDFINIMSYDKTGPWTPNTPGPHSPFSMVQEDFDYFNKTRKVPAEKLLIGLPFYGYQFGNTVSSLNYKDIISLYPGSENADSVNANGGGKIYYNGIPTIKQKVSFALANKTAGVMIWELHQDSNDSKSLLKAINDTKNQ